MTHPFAVEVEGLHFYYTTPKRQRIWRSLPFKRLTTEKKVALDEVTLKIRDGRITALLGKNGSGKTSLIRLITGSRIPQRGRITVLGSTPTVSRAKIGLCMGTTLIYHRLTGRENLDYFGCLYGVTTLAERIEELATLLELTPVLDQMVESYSFGMKAKLALARSMIHSPKLLILDEPTLGIDLHLANQIREFIQKLECTVLLTTHYMDEADQLAEDLIVIDNGSILESGQRNELLGRYGARNIAELFTRVVGNAKGLRIAS